MYFLSYSTKYTPAKYALSKIRTWMVNSGLLVDAFSSGNYQEEMNYLRDLLERYYTGEKLNEEEASDMIEVDKFLKAHPELILRKSKLEKVDSSGRSIEAYNNALIDIMYSILTSKDAFKTMVSGANTSMFADVIDNLEKVEGQKESSDRLFDPSFITDTYYEYMAGKALTGVFASNSANHSMLQFYDVNLKKEDAITLDGRSATRISPVKTLDGRENVTNILGSFLATVVDNAKTLTASKINLNMFTASTYTLLLRMGFDPKTVMYFMSQPSLRLLSDKVMASGDMFSYQDKIAELIKVYSKRTSEEVKMKLKNAGFTSFYPKHLLGAIENYNKKGGDIDLYENAKQVLILEAFRNMTGPATTLRAVNSAMRSETYGAAPNPGEVIADISKAKRLVKRRAFLGLDDVLRLIPRGQDYKMYMSSPSFKKSILSANTNGVMEYNKFLSNYTPFNTKAFKYLRKEIVNNINDDLNGEEIDTLNNLLISKIAEGLDFFKFTDKQKSAWIFKYPRRFAQIVAEDPYLSNENEFTRRLSVQNEWQNTLGRRQSIPIIKYNGSRLDNEVAKDEAIRAFEYLWRNPKYTKLAEDLLKYNFVTSGFSVTPFSFSHIIPISMINNIPGFNELFREEIFEDHAKFEIDATSLVDSFLVNNFRNNKFVPEITEGDNYKFSDTEHSQLVVDHASPIFMKNGEYIKKYFPFVKFNNKGKIELYKLVVFGRENATYKRTNGAGTNIIFEDYHDSGEQSNFSTNNISEKLRKASDTNAETAFREGYSEMEDILENGFEPFATFGPSEHIILSTKVKEELDKVSKEAEQIKNHCKGM